MVDRRSHPHEIQGRGMLGRVGPAQPLRCVWSIKEVSVSGVSRMAYV